MPAEVGDFVEAFEAARDRDGHADLDDHLPPADHPDRLAVLCELVRVDLEYRWEARRARRSWTSTAARFPDLFRRPGHAAREIAFEEDRLRRRRARLRSPREYRQRGSAVDGGSKPAHRPEPRPGFASSAADDDPLARAGCGYRDIHGPTVGFDDACAASRVPTEHADLFRDLHADRPARRPRLAQAVADWPEAGIRVPRLPPRGRAGPRRVRPRLPRPAGRPGRPARGPEGRARHGRRVADPGPAPAHQHRADLLDPPGRAVPGRLHALPRLDDPGRRDRRARTPRDAARLGRGAAQHPRIGEGGPPGRSRRRRDARAAEAGPRPARPASRPPAAEAIARSERLRGLGLRRGRPLDRPRGWPTAWPTPTSAGILHRDLKPANVLFADDGEPMLLDFNLAAGHQASAATPRPRSSAAPCPTWPPSSSKRSRGPTGRSTPGPTCTPSGVILFELLDGPPPVRDPSRPGRGGAAADDRRPRRAAAGAPPPQPGPLAGRRVDRPPPPGARPRRVATSPRASSGKTCVRQLDNLPLKHAPEPSLRERVRKWTPAPPSPRLLDERGDPGRRSSWSGSSSGSWRGAARRSAWKRSRPPPPRGRPQRRRDPAVQPRRSPRPDRRGRRTLPAGPGPLSGRRIAGLDRRPRRFVPPRRRRPPAPRGRGGSPLLRGPRTLVGGGGGIGRRASGAASPRPNRSPTAPRTRIRRARSRAP